MKEHIIREDAVRFLKSFLQDGSWLANSASRLVLEGDELQTWLPDHVLISGVSLKDGWGQRDMPLTENYWRPLEELTRRFLDQSPDHVAVVEAYVGYEPERIPKDGVARIFHFVCDSVVDHRTRSAADGLHHVDVFGYLSGAGHSIEQVADFIEEASRFVRSLH